MTLENIFTKFFEIIELKIIKIKEEKNLGPNYSQIFHIYFHYNTNNVEIKVLLNLLFDCNVKLYPIVQFTFPALHNINIANAYIV